MVNAFLSTNTEKKLVICGKGHHIIKSNRIIYTGYIEDKELDYLYQNCSAFIFPSKYEGFGLPILEALSYHCKVFSSNAGSLGEFSSEIIHFFNPYEEKELVTLINNCDNIKIDNNAIDKYLENLIGKLYGMNFTILFNNMISKKEKITFIAALFFMNVRVDLIGSMSLTELFVLTQIPHLLKWLNEQGKKFLV